VQKVTAINAKHGPFDACVVAGDLFAPGSDGGELDGVARKFCVGALTPVPVPTYWTVGRNALPHRVVEALGRGPEVAPNLVYLGAYSLPDAFPPPLPLPKPCLYSHTPRGGKVFECGAPSRHARVRQRGDGGVAWLSPPSAPIFRPTPPTPSLSPLPAPSPTQRPR
jgi:hypothetical protein